VEAAHLMRDARPKLMERFGVKRRAVGGDAVDRQAPRIQAGLEVSQKRVDIGRGRVAVFEDAITQAGEGTAVDQG
jgi:hypothetical protein